jgi:hypothetical protein
MDGSRPNHDHIPNSNDGLSAGPSSAASTSAPAVSGAAEQDDPAAGGAVRFDRAHELFEHMKSQTERLKFAAGEVIFRSGARSMDRVFVLLSGKVVAFKESQSGADLSGRPSFASSSSVSSLFPPSTADATFATATSAPAQALSQRTIAIGEVLGGHAALTGALHGARGICVVCPLPLTLCRGMISADNVLSLPFLSFRSCHLCHSNQAKRSCACRRAKWPSSRRGRSMAPLLLCLSLLCSAALSLNCSRPSGNLSRWVCRYADMQYYVSSSLLTELYQFSRRALIHAFLNRSALIHCSARRSSRRTVCGARRAARIRNVSRHQRASAHGRSCGRHTARWTSCVICCLVLIIDHLQSDVPN